MDIQCMRLWHTIDEMTGGAVWLNARFGQVEVKAPLGKGFRHRAWNHVCWSYINNSSNSSSSSSHSLFLNGVKLNTVNDGVKMKKVRLGHVNGLQITDEALVIGQDQDTIRGTFDVAQLFNGKVTELNVWNRAMDEESIQDMSMCKSFPKGNLLRWSLRYIRAHNVTVERSNDLAGQLCLIKTTFAIFPYKRLHRRALALCTSYGGKLAVPDNIESNTEIMELISKHAGLCTDKSGLAAWLGLTFNGQTWQHLNGRNQSLAYTNWKSTPTYITEGDCSAMQVVKA